MYICRRRAISISLIQNHCDVPRENAQGSTPNNDGKSIPGHTVNTKIYRLIIIYFIGKYETLFL